MQKSERKQKKIEYYKKLISSSKDYINYLETFGDSPVQEDSDLDALKVGYATFALLLWKEEYIKKDQAKNLSTILVDKLLEGYIGTIAKKEGDTWKIGDITFSSNLSVVDTLRNKLAHGDFSMDSSDITIEVEGKTGSIPITDLVAFAVHLGNDWTLMKKYGENTTDILRNLNALTNNRIETKEDLEDAIRRISYIEITDKPQLLRERNLAYLQMAYFLKDKVMKEIERGHSVVEIPKTEHAKRLLDATGMKVTITEKPATELEQIEKVKKMYLQKLPFLKDLDPYFQQKYLAHWIHEATTHDRGKKSICHGLLANQVFLKDLSEKRKQSVVELVGESEYAIPLALTNEKTILSAYLASFYFTYIYGLDSILKIENKEDIRDIINGEALDFSRLNLEEIKGVNFLEEKDYPEFQEQIRKMQKEKDYLQFRIENIKRSLTEIKKQIEEGIEEKRRPYQELQSLLKTLEEEQRQLEEMILLCEEFMKTRYEKYRRNRSIIEHLRNSIAHGKVDLDIFQGKYTIEDALMTFQDIYDEKKVFECSVTAEQFYQLTSEENVKYILDFLDKKDSKDQINEKGVQK